jgi:hypothetical protein
MTASKLIKCTVHVEVSRGSSEKPEPLSGFDQSDADWTPDVFVTVP